MLNVKNYLEEIRHVIQANSAAQLKMFVLRYVKDDPKLHMLLNLNKKELKLYLIYLKKEILPLIEEELSDMSDDPFH